MQSPISMTTVVLMSVTDTNKTIMNVRTNLQSKTCVVARTYGIPAIKKKA
jgi:hypothetical protein